MADQGRILAIAVCAFALSGATLAATRTYDTGAFEQVSVAAGVDVDISLGARQVTADTKSDNFDDLLITVKDNELRIERPAGSWFSGWLWPRPSYKVRVVTPALHSLKASSGSDVTIKGILDGDLSVSASSGSDVDVSLVKGGNVTLHASSGSDMEIDGSCASLKVDASSGSDIDADDLRCENVSIQVSSGSDVSVTATKSVTGSVSSGADVKIKGKPPAVQVEKSSGGNFVLGE